MTEFIKENAPADESKAENLNSLAIAKLLKEDKPESAGSIDLHTISAFVVGSLVASRNPNATISVGSRVAAMFEKVAPESIRREIAMGSPLFSREIARDFRAGIDKLFPNIESRLAASRTQRQAAADVVVETGARPGEPVHKKYDRLAMAGDGLYKEAAEAVQASMQGVTKDLHFPTPRVVFNENISARGNYSLGLNLARINPAKMEKEGAVAATSYHELGHGEQAYVSARKVADDLKLGKTATPEEMEKFVRAWAVSIGRQSKLISADAAGIAWRSNTERYLHEALQLRNGVALSPAQEERAVKLIGAFSGHNPGIVAERTRIYLATNPKAPGISKHLTYKSLYTELEAHMLNPLVK